MSKTSITLPDKLDISAVISLKSRLEKALEKDANEIEVSGQNVENVDSAAVQLLLSFQKKVLSVGKEIRFVKTSDKMVAGVKLLGASSLLNLEEID